MSPSPPFVQLLGDLVWVVVTAMIIANTLVARSTSRIQRTIAEQQKELNAQLSEHRREHDQLAATMIEATAPDRPPANLDWRCAACGVSGVGYCPPELEVVFACPICGVQAEVRHGAADVT